MPPFRVSINPIGLALCLNAALASYSLGLHSMHHGDKKHSTLKQCAALKGLANLQQRGAALFPPGQESDHQEDKTLSPMRWQVTGEQSRIIKIQYI